MGQYHFQKGRVARETDLDVKFSVLVSAKKK